MRSFESVITSNGVFGAKHFADEAFGKGGLLVMDSVLDDAARMDDKTFVVSESIAVVDDVESIFGKYIKLTRPKA